MRVLICDDSAFMRRAIRSMLESDDEIVVVGVAHNGKQAVELAHRHCPDVITMDIEMPVMDGLTALRTIMSDCPTHVVMVSSLTTAGSKAALDALRCGAADVFAKDHSTVSANIDELRDDLVRRVRALAVSNKPARRPQVPSSVEPAAAPAASPASRARDETIPDIRTSEIDLVVIGSSTGGPPVLERVLKAVPSSSRTPIIVAQHMPRMFTASMSERLDHLCGPRVVHLRPGMQIEPGTIHVAPGGENVHLKRGSKGKLSARIDREPASTVYFPSVDELFSSAADTVGRRTLAIVLTGMGEDGGEGARRIANRGGKVLAQDDRSCVVYGMPKAVVTRGAATAVLSPVGIARVLQGVCDGNRAAA
jgi:two-component system chemotaxis response regulator CheB